MASGQVGWQDLAEPSQGFRTSDQSLGLRKVNDVNGTKASNLFQPQGFFLRPQGVGLLAVLPLKDGCSATRARLWVRFCLPLVWISGVKAKTPGPLKLQRNLSEGY